MAADRKPRKMLIGSIIIMVLATIGGIAATAIGFSKAFNVIQDLSKAEQTQVPGPATVEGTGGSFSVWSVGSSSLNCVVATGSGESVTLEPPSANGSATAENGGESFDFVGSFDADTGTRYEVTCNGSSSADARFIVADVAFSDFLLYGGIGLGGIFGGLGLFFIGVIFFIVALFRRSSWKKSNAYPGPQGGPPPPGGTAGPPPPGGGFGGPPPTPGGPPQGGPPSPTAW